MRHHIAWPTLNLVGLSRVFVYTYIPATSRLPVSVPAPCAHATKAWKPELPALSLPLCTVCLHSCRVRLHLVINTLLHLAPHSHLSPVYRLPDTRAKPAPTMLRFARAIVPTTSSIPATHPCHVDHPQHLRAVRPHSCRRPARAHGPHIW